MKFIVLALSYALILGAQWLSDKYSIESSGYYLLLCLTCFVLFYVCFFSVDKIIEGYAYIQLGAMALYAGMINPVWYWHLKPIMYLWEVNYANVILSYELIMLLGGVWDVIQIITRWLNDSNLHSINYKRVNK